MLWLLIAQEVLPTAQLAAVLTGLSIFSVAFLVVDNGTTYLGARQAATRTLDSSGRCSIVRLRLQLAVLSGLVGLAVSTTGGQRTMLAFAPYILALLLVAVLNVWEPWGAGNPKPIATWIALRGVALLLLVGLFAIAKLQLPVWAPGAVECLCVFAIATSFELRLARSLRLAFGADHGPWRSAALVGGPPILFQAALAAGAVILNAQGQAATTAAFIIGVRILSGVTNGASYLGGSLFPHLARASRPESQEGTEGPSLIGLMLLGSVVMGCLATMITCVAYRLLLHLFLGTTHVADPAALVALLCAAPVAGCVIILWNVLIARGDELRAFMALLTGTLFTILVELAVSVWSPHHLATWMATTLALGQVVTYARLIRATRKFHSAQQASLRAGTFGSALAIIVVLPTLFAPSMAIGSGIAEAIVSAGALLLVLAILLRPRKRRPAPARDGPASVQV